MATAAAWVSFAIALSDEQWELVADLFDPPGRRGAPAVIPRRAMVDAILLLGQGPPLAAGSPDDAPATPGGSRQPRRVRVDVPDESATAPLHAAVQAWVERVPSLRLDGGRPTAPDLAACLASFWIPNCGASTGPGRAGRSRQPRALR